MTVPANTVDISILGPLSARRGDVDVTPTAHREQLILALLALDPRHSVSVHRLTETLWNQDPPPTARNSIQVAVSRLRKQLGSTDEHPILSTTPSGYVLHAEDVSVDAFHFVDAFDAVVRKLPAHVGAGQTTDAELLEAMQHALSMWHDRHVLIDLQSSVDILVLARQLERKRLDLVEALGSALIAIDPRSALDAVEHDAHLEWDRPALQVTYLRALVANGSAREARKWGAHLVGLHDAERTPMDAVLTDAAELRFEGADAPSVPAAPGT